MSPTPNSLLLSPTIFGIRHHGPGSARSLRAALEQLRPDAILVEGPPDAAEVLPLLAHADMRPPVALLIYAPEAPRRAVYYPFAIFSPEWQALHYGLTQGIPDEFAAVLTKDAAFPKRLGRPEEYAKLALAIVENPMLNGQCIRLDGGQRFAPK